MAKLRYRTFFRVFIPATIVVSISLLLSVFFLSGIFMDRTRKILVQGEQSRLTSAIKLFSQIQMSNLPAYASVIDTGPIMDYLYGRDISKEKTLRALEMLDRTSLSNTCIDSLYLYNNIQGILSTKSGLEGFSNPSDPDFFKLLAGIHSYGLSKFILRKVIFTDTSSPSNLITIILGNMPPQGKSMRFAFVANLSERDVRVSLSIDGSAVSQIYIVNDEGLFISHPDAEKFGTNAGADERFTGILSKLQPEGSATVYDTAGTGWIASWQDQTEFRYRFISMSKRNEVFAPILHIRDLVFFVVGIVLTAAITALYILFRMEEEFQQQSKRALNYLHRNGDEDTADISQTETSHKFLSLKGSCTIAVISIDEYFTPGRINSEMLFREGFTGQVRHAEVLQDTVNRYILLYETLSDTKLVLDTVLQHARAVTGKPVGGYLADSPVAIEKLPEIYMVLNQAFPRDYIRDAGTVSVVNCTNPHITEAVGSGDISGKYISDLEQAFRSGRQTDIQNFSDALLTAIRNAGNEDLFKYVLSMLSRRIPQILGDDAELVLGDTEKFQSNLLSCRHLDQVKNVLYTTADKIGERIPSLAERKKKELIQKIKKNIEQHLSDRSLCTALIASDAGLSTGYVRNLFKNSEGISILEYIGSQRLELAKQYLSETDMPVWGICTKTGFINYSYFFTYFRKMTGLTPVEFRQKARSLP